NLRQQVHRKRNSDVSQEVVQTQAGSEPRRTVKCGRRGQRTVACRYFGYGQRRRVQSFGKSGGKATVGRRAFTSFQKGTKNNRNAFRIGRKGRANAKGSGGSAGNISVLHIPP